MTTTETLFTDDIPRLSQKSYEWYTPVKYIEASRHVMKRIALDPASCTEVNTNVVRAEHYYDIAHDGLTQTWFGEVFCNPPYCKSTNGISNQEMWTRKLIAEYEIGNVKQAILLVNAATETLWFQRLYDYTICFVRGRIQFNGPNNAKSGATVGSVFVYFGKDDQRFIEVFSQFGRIVKTVDSPAAQPTLWDEEAS